MSLSLYKYETRTLSGTVVDPNNADTPVDLDAANGGILTMEFEIKAHPGDADPALVHKSIGAGITVLNQATYPGQYTITLAIADLAPIVSGTYWYDVMATFTDGSRFYVVKPSPVHIRDVVNPVAL